LPLIVYNILCGECELALPAIAGLELLKVAAEVLDDIEDADSAKSLPSKYGVPLALNTASTLIILAEKAFTLLKDNGVSDAVVVSLINTVNSYYTTTCMGQHLDLSLTPDAIASEDTYLRVIAMKSASVVECACYTGALLAGANQELINSFAIFGHNLGMASQIANDIKAVINLKDIKNRKITLPAIFALARTEGKTHRLMDEMFCKRSLGFDFAPDQIRDLLFSTGAMQYAAIKREIYNQEAKDILMRMKTEGIKVEQLQQFLN